jgi:hypothetical protein
MLVSVLCIRRRRSDSSLDPIVSVKVRRGPGADAAERFENPSVPTGWSPANTTEPAGRSLELVEVEGGALVVDAERF